MTYSDTLTTQEFNKLPAKERAVVKAAEHVLANIEADIESDRVCLPVTDMYGNPLPGMSHSTNLNGAMQAMQAFLSAASQEEEEEEEPLLAIGQKIEKDTQEFLQQKTAPQPAMKPSISSYEQLGLDFLTDTPSLPTKTVKLHLSGPVKFGTSLDCHALAMNDQVVVLVTDKRIKPEIIDLSFDDPDVKVELQLDEEQRIEVYPPVPQILTYDIGALRHFVFIRKYG